MCENRKQGHFSLSLSVAIKHYFSSALATNFPNMTLKLKGKRVSLSLRHRCNTSRLEVCFLSSLSSLETWRLQMEEAQKIRASWLFFFRSARRRSRRTKNYFLVLTYICRIVSCFWFFAMLCSDSSRLPLPSFVIDAICQVKLQFKPCDLRLSIDDVFRRSITPSFFASYWCFMSMCC